MGNLVFNLIVIDKTVFSLKLKKPKNCKCQLYNIA